MIVTASVMDPTVNGTDVELGGAAVVKSTGCRAVMVVPPVLSDRHDRNARVTGDSLTFQRAVGSGISFLGTRVMTG